MSNFIGGAIVVVIILVWIFGRGATKDDTDPPDGHSGMYLYTDHKTGLQYLGGGLFGGITPRLDESGKHMKAEQKE